MKRSAEALALFVLILFGFCSSARASQATIRVGVYQNKPKVFIDEKGRARGFFIDILEYIADKENWELVYVPGTWEQCLIRLQNDQIDLLVDVADSVARIGLFDFSREDVFSNWATIYVPEDSTVDSILDLRHKTIVAMKGDISYREFRHKLKRLDIICRFKEVDSFADVLSELDQNSANAGIISRLFGLEQEDQYHAKRTEIICCPKNLYFATPKHKRKWIINVIDRHLRQLKADEASLYYTSLSKWIEGIPTKRLPRWLILSFSSTAALLTLFVAGFIVLRTRINARSVELKKSNAELEAARQRLLSQMNSLKTINTIADRLYRSLDYNTVIQEAVDAMASYSQTPLVAFFEYQEGADSLKLLASRGFENGMLEVCSRLPVDDSLTSQAIAEKGVVVCNDIETDQRVAPKISQQLAEHGLESIYAVPLIYEDTVFGVMNLVFGQKVSMEHEQLETLLSMGKAMALALANARHVEQMKQEITSRKKTEKEKAALQRQLLHAQKMEAIGTLAGGIAHDFNNILHGIYGYVQIMTFNKGEDDPDLKFLKQIEEIALKAGKVVRQLLTFSREIESELKPNDLNQLIRQELNLLEKSLSKMIEVRLLLEPELKPIQADAVQLEQVLLNLCINAGHAMGESGRLTIRTGNISLSDEQAGAMGLSGGDHVVLSITDTGHGMEKEVIERIFEPFFTTKTDGKGTGLGLSMVYGIVKQHGGHIVCSSEPGRGTHFDVYFPAIKLNNGPTERVKSDFRHSGNETILLVDDEPAILDVTKHMLMQFGYTVLSMEIPENAIEYFKHRKNRIDLVILDIYMPKTSGLSCMAQLLELDPEVKVIVSSGNVSRETRARALRAGARAFIAKPYRIEDLLKTIREVLNGESPV